MKQVVSGLFVGALRKAQKPRRLELQDAPLQPVIGLAEGENRWRGHDASGQSSFASMPRLTPGRAIKALYQRST